MDKRHQPLHARITIARYFRPVGVSLAILGSLLLGIANETVTTLSFVLLLGIGGSAVAFLIDRNTRFGCDAYWTSFGTCVFVAGCAQLWAVETTGFPMTTIDCNTYYGFVRGPQRDISVLKNIVNAPLPVYVWQRVYTIAGIFGTTEGPWIAVVFNSLLIGISASLTISTARLSSIRFDERAVTIILLSAGCGLYWLSGALFLRESFALIAIAIVLREFVYAIRFPRLETLVRLAVIIVVTNIGLWYIRSASVVIVGGFTLLFLSVSAADIGRSSRRFVYLASGILILAFFVVYAGEVILTKRDEVAGYAQKYTAGSKSSAASNSLGVRYVVDQPLPIRVVLGSIYAVIFPVPFWGGFLTGQEYDFIKSWQAIYFISIFPLVLTGSSLTLRRFRQGDVNSIQELFIVGFSLIALASIAVVTLETRHLAQFMPAFILLASIPGVSEHTRLASRILRQWSMLWFGAVGMLYAAWFVMK